MIATVRTQPPARAIFLFMDFGWPSDSSDFVEKTLEFARTELNQTVMEREASNDFGAEEWRKCGRFGLLGAAISREYGGLGLNCLMTGRVFEAFGKGCRDGGLGMSVGAHLFACVVPIAQFANTAVREEWVPSLVSGDKIGSIAITEPDAGSDIFSLKTRAERVAGGYRLTGEKTFITNAPVADIFLVYASTNPEGGFFGISAFIVERNSNGITVGAPMRKVGLKTSPMSSVYLHDCIVPERNHLGTEGQGGVIFNASMNWERTCLFAFWLGTIERQLDEVIAYAKKRKQFGRPIAANQAISHRIVNMKMRLEAARLLLYRACWEVDQGISNPLSVSLAKLALSEAAVQSSLDGIQIFGGLGIVSETGMERYLRDSIAGTIYSGTSEMHREIIARHLGLSKGPSKKA